MLNKQQAACRRGRSSERREVKLSNLGYPNLWNNGEYCRESRGDRAKLKIGEILLLCNKLFLKSLTLDPSFFFVDLRCWYRGCGADTVHVMAFGWSKLQGRPQWWMIYYKQQSIIKMVFHVSHATYYTGTIICRMILFIPFPRPTCGPSLFHLTSNLPIFTWQAPRVNPRSLQKWPSWQAAS